MANTTNLDLVKPAGTDHALISVLNSNSDKIDAFAGTTNTAISAVQNGLAYIVGNTNTTGSTLAVGQFVYVKGHSTIAEGLRKVTASISANGSITTSNTDACSEGGLNALNSKIADSLKYNPVITNLTISSNSAVINIPEDADQWMVICHGFIYSTSTLQMEARYFIIMKRDNSIYASKIYEGFSPMNVTITNVIENTTNKNISIIFSGIPYFLGTAFAYKK